MNLYRTHHCGELRVEHIGQRVRLAGWMHCRRDHGNLIFIDLRDYYGITQLVFGADSPYKDFASKTRSESVLIIEGNVVARSVDTVNDKLDTGKIEVAVDKLKVESEADILPFEVNTDRDCSEELRLKYRFLDLRRESLKNNIVLRSTVSSFIRRFMEDRGFPEITTPILTASSPEGARDFVVPSRLQRGKFYALPQSPQIFKQLLMVSGFDKYFQIAPCFRDEDARADRSPGEFYQVDIEMSFVEREDILNMAEDLILAIFTKFSKHVLTAKPFPRFTYDEAMLYYGTDKPDLRNPVILADVTDLFRKSDFSVFVRNIDKGMSVRAIPVNYDGSALPRSFFDKKIQFAQSLGASGLAYIAFADGEAKGPVAKLLNADIIAELKRRLNLSLNDLVFFSCDHPDKAAYYAGEIRKLLGEELDLCKKNTFSFCWVTDFPYFEKDKNTGKIGFAHNPFSMPIGGAERLNTADPLAVRADQYDIVCNGIELSSGAIRNHIPSLLYKAFEIAGYSRQTVVDNFGSMMRALEYGAPPHGGIAPGLDRIIMLLADVPNIREVVCFPMMQSGLDPLTGAPSTLSPAQLKELGIKL